MVEYMAYKKRGRKLKLCYYNGEFKSLEEISIPVTDLLVQRGVGVFDTLRTYRKRPHAMSIHLKRLEESSHALGINLPLDIQQIIGVIRKGIAMMDCEEVQMRIYVSGGDVFEDGQFPHPRFFVIFEPLEKAPRENYERGVALAPIDMDRPFPHIKSVFYLPAYVGRRDDKEALEVLYCPDGEITESSSSSFFMVIDDRIVTAPTGRVLDGVMRQIIINLAEESGLKVEMRCPLLSEVSTAQEAFITGSIKEILPVRRIGSQHLAQVNGPVSQYLQHLYSAKIGDYLE